MLSGPKMSMTDSWKQLLNTERIMLRYLRLLVQNHGSNVSAIDTDLSKFLRKTRTMTGRN